jgi:ser/thr/tyr protein kinase RAD53
MIQADKVKKTAANGNGGDVDPRKATAFAREISILEQLSHPNICQLKETFFDDVGHNISAVPRLAFVFIKTSHYLRRSCFGASGRW